MLKYAVIFLILLFEIFYASCSKTKNIISLKIEGAFQADEIGLEKYADSKNDKFYRIGITNEKREPIEIYVTGDSSQFYSPESVEYSFYDVSKGTYRWGNGRGDYYSVSPLVLSSGENRNFYFLSTIPSNTDTVIFYFRYIQKSMLDIQNCTIKTKYISKGKKLGRQIGYENICMTKDKDKK